MYQQQRRKPHGWEKYNTLLAGIVIGLVVPFVGLAFLMMANENLAAADIQTSNGIFDGLSDRLVRLLAICLNLIPFTIFSNRRMMAAMRGVFIPTIVYALIWLSIYSAQILAGEL
jgi:hypothetical protein